MPGPRTTAAPAAGGTRWEEPGWRRALQLALAALWLLDAVLQYQTFMFSQGFPRMLAATAAGNPGPVAGPVTWTAHLIGTHPEPQPAHSFVMAGAAMTNGGGLMAPPPWVAGVLAAVLLLIAGWSAPTGSPRCGRRPRRRSPRHGSPGAGRRGRAGTGPGRLRPGRRTPGHRARAHYPGPGRTPGQRAAARRPWPGRPTAGALSPAGRVLPDHDGRGHGLHADLDALTAASP
jgi:hypothetical protein